MPASRPAYEDALVGVPPEAVREAVREAADARREILLVIGRHHSR